MSKFPRVLYVKLSIQPKARIGPNIESLPHDLTKSNVVHYANADKSSPDKISKSADAASGRWCRDAGATLHLAHTLSTSFERIFSTDPPIRRLPRTPALTFYFVCEGSPGM